MNAGLQTTFDVLAETANEAAADVLVGALDSPRRLVRRSAVEAILKRKSPAGLREVIRRLHEKGDEWRDILSRYRGRCTSALRNAVLSLDGQIVANGCQAAVWFADYDVTPALITAAEDEGNPHADRAASALLALAESLYQELAGPRDYSRRRDPQLVRRHVVGSLETSLQDFPRHQRREIVEACLLLAGREDVAFQKIIQAPGDPSYEIVVDALTHSERPGVMRLLLSMLDDPSAPAAIVQAAMDRSDLKFVRHLLRKCGGATDATVARNLRRVERIAWLGDDLSLLDELDDSDQASAVRLALASGMRRPAAFRVVEHVFRYGKPGGRRAAAVALQQYGGADANDLIVIALRDDDAAVRATALAQLRQRGMPGSLKTLIGQLDSPHEIIRQAARSQLSELSFPRYITAFDMLDEDVQRSSGELVKKVDLETVPLLAKELNSSSRVRRLRAVAAAVAMDAVGDLQDELIALLEDEDHMVRAETCRALRGLDTTAARMALEDALGDRSPIVQDVARDSLEQFA